MSNRNWTVAVLIPCYNEAITIGKVVDDFHRVLPEATIYVYDNNSSDGTGDIAREHGAVVRVERRQGKGNVVRQMMRDINADYYIMAKKMTAPSTALVITWCARLSSGSTALSSQML